MDDKQSLTFCYLCQQVKWLAYILSLHILLSNLGPALEGTSFPLEWLCCDEDTQAPQQTQDNTEHQACNPFIHCHCCIGYVSTHGEAFVWFSFSLIVHEASYRPMTSIILSHPIWHPPQV